MKLTTVEIHPENSSEVIILSFRDPKRTNSYNVKAIIGLDADEIVPRYYGKSGVSGKKFFNLTLEKRDITLRVELNPNFSEDESYSSLRDALFKVIASSRTGAIEIQFKNVDEVVAVTSGFIKKFEASQFTKNPEVQITVQCDDPMLRAPLAVSLDVEGLDPMQTLVIDSLSTAPHGFKFEIEFMDAATSFIIGDPFDADWSFRVIPTPGFVSGDQLYFSSEFNDKYLYVVRGVSTIHLADAVQPGSIWPILFPGENNLGIEGYSGLDWVSITHFPTYWGV